MHASKAAMVRGRLLRSVSNRLALKICGTQAAVGQSGRVAITKGGCGQLVKLLFKRHQVFSAPVAIPSGFGFVFYLQLFDQVLQNTQVVNGVNVAGNGLRQCAYLGATQAVCRQQRRHSVIFV